MAKILCTLGYAILPEVRERVGYRVACELADGTVPEPAGPLGDTSAPREGEDCDVAIVGSGAGGATAAAVLAEAGLDVVVLEAGGHYDRSSYPRHPIDAIISLYRDAGLTVADGRPPVPIPVGRAVGGTTVINSGTCFRAPDRSARALAGARPASPGPPTSTPSTRRPRSSSASPRSIPSGWVATASWRWRARRPWAPAAGRSTATPAAACSAAPARSAARSTPSAACTSPTCPAPSPPERGCGRTSRSAGSCSRVTGRSASSASPARPAPRTGSRGRSRSAPTR